MLHTLSNAAQWAGGTSREHPQSMGHISVQSRQMFGNKMAIFTVRDSLCPAQGPNVSQTEIILTQCGTHSPSVGLETNCGSH